jgi:hypothetical protein
MVCTRLGVLQRSAYDKSRTQLFSLAVATFAGDKYRSPMPSEASERLLDEAQRLLTAAKSLIEGSLGAEAQDGDGRGSGRLSPPNVLSLYDELCRRLAAIDDGEVRELLSRITAAVEQLVELARGVEGLSVLRRRMDDQ